jgi:hypothetical protein
MGGRQRPLRVTEQVCNMFEERAGGNAEARTGRAEPVVKILGTGWRCWDEYLIFFYASLSRAT